MIIRAAPQSWRSSTKTLTKHLEVLTRRHFETQVSKMMKESYGKSNNKFIHSRDYSFSFTKILDRNQFIMALIFKTK